MLAARPLPTHDSFDGARVEEVVRLRHWALRLLASSDRWAAVPPPAAAPSWHLFLFTERCALPLRAKLRETGSRLREGEARALRYRARLEMSRVVAARRQLRELSVAVASLAHRVVVLKGAHHVQAGGVLDLGDIDLLLLPASASQLESAMQAMGYARVAGHGGNPQRRLARASGLPVELHIRSPYGVELEAAIERATRLDPAFLGLAPTDHLAHLLLHATRDYGRIGSIRDLLLLAAAIRSCDPDQSLRLVQALRTHPRGPTIVALFEMSSRLVNGIEPELRFSEAAAARCLVASQRPSRVVPPQLRDRVFATAFALLDGGIGWRRAMGTAWLDLDASSPTASLDWILRSVPQLGRLVRGTGRTVSSLAATPGAILLARRAQRLASAASMLGA